MEVMSFEDENDKEEIKVGNYQTKYFHVCPGASSLYGDIESKGVDMDMAERSVRLQDALFFVEEHIQRDGYKPEKDYVMVAKNLAKNIMKMAELMGLEKEHHYIQGHVDTIIKTVEGKKLEERVIELTEKNVPTNPSKWSYYKSQAKKKFDVYPSAYANAWAAKQYKAAGGGWRTTKESVDEKKNLSEAIKGRNNRTGESFGMVVGSDKQTDEGFEVVVRKQYSSRISSYKFTFNSNGEVISVLDYGYSMDGSFPDMKGSGSARVIQPTKRNSIKSIGDITTPAFAKKIYLHVQKELKKSKSQNRTLAMSEATRGEIHKAAKKGSYPATIVVSEKGKVVYQELVKTPQLVPAIFMILQKKYPNAKISVESKSGETLFTEAMDKGKKLKIYNKLKKGDNITIKYGSSIRRDNEKEFVVSKGKTKVGKAQVERIILKNIKNPKGVKYYLYNRDGNVSMAIGDMAATIEDMYESVNEGLSVTDERHFGKKGIIIMIDDNGKKVSAIFKNKKNADKYNRNKSSDLQTLLKLAKNTPYPKAIDESVNEYFVENYDDTNQFVEFMKENKTISEAEYQGRKVELNKIMQGDVKKFKVYVKNPKGNVVKVNFGHKGKGGEKTMRIKKSDPARRKAFRSRHNCDNPGPKHKARYWACRTW
jgi:hypothetical protein